MPAAALGLGAAVVTRRDTVEIMLETVANLAGIPCNGPPYRNPPPLDEPARYIGRPPPDLGAGFAALPAARR